MRLLGSLIYWLAVFALSLALVVGLVLLLESLDQSGIESQGRGQTGFPLTHSATGSARSSRPNTTIRCAALYSGWQAVSTSWS